MLKKSTLIRLMRWYPPFWGAGIRPIFVSPDFRKITVELKLRFWNQNYLGTQFGGSLYSMTDPFYMLMLIENLGPGFTVWDKSASIRYFRPGRGRVCAHFHLSEEEIVKIRQQVTSAGKLEPSFTIEIRDDAGDLIAQVEKTISVRIAKSNP